ncbi:hypothetical protein BDK51DRAFT_27575 [Blyttiomyces helicus]|uniref:Lysosomal dipeptide transporter MFSD1 n=1 Tax=Blyttiomyces helicus TaxID=388810 RepID=A0A4P9W8I5_9FUNG|nr:hypothetical protein BDK51DRAFT_27575 [Blyttiomyces helicus]|eukprot:RKO88841.1 hypothetical protein BDK51DRAFT_27575 [Blyttiomyces helicus]
MAIPDIICVISGPLWAPLVDRAKGRGAPLLILLSGALIATAHICLSAPAPILGLVLLGIGYGLCSKIFWPLIEPAVPDSRDVLDALAIATALMNLGLALGSLLVASAAATDSSYYSANIILAGFATAGALLGAALWALDHRRKNTDPADADAESEEDWEGRCGPGSVGDPTRRASGTARWVTSGRMYMCEEDGHGAVRLSFDDANGLAIGVLAEDAVEDGRERRVSWGNSTGLGGVALSM